MRAKLTGKILSMQPGADGDVCVVLEVGGVVSAPELSVSPDPNRSRVKAVVRLRPKPIFAEKLHYGQMVSFTFDSVPEE